jgi:hypothetical protein
MGGLRLLRDSVQPREHSKVVVVTADRDWERWFWIITSALVIAVVGALHSFGGSSPTSNSTSIPQAANSGPLPAQGEIATSRLSLHAAPEAPRIATVFECRINGQRIYSDQRCGSNADERPILAPNRMDAQDTGILSSPDDVIARSRSERTNASEPVFDASRSECSSIDEKKDSINARMREGYTSPEGEWFRDRLRVLGARYYELRCRHFR